MLKKWLEIVVKWSKKPEDSLLLSKHSIQFSALFLLLSECGQKLFAEKKIGRKKNYTKKIGSSKSQKRLPKIYSKSGLIKNILTSDRTFWLNTLILVFIATSKYGTPIWPQTRDEYPPNRAKIHNHGNILFHGQIWTREVFALCDLLR